MVVASVQNVTEVRAVLPMYAALVMVQGDVPDAKVRVSLKVEYDIQTTLV